MGAEKFPVPRFLAKHLKEELQAHLKEISDVGNPKNDIVYSKLRSLDTV